MDGLRDQPDDGAGVEIAPGICVPRATLRFSFVGSSGPGGQNVNKRATKAVLRVAIADLPVNTRVRERVRRLGRGWLVEPTGTPDGASDTDTDLGELVIMADEHRSQRRNREACLERLRELLVRAMAKPKPRVATKPGRGAIERRLREKRERSEKKQRRRDRPDDA